MGNRHSNTEANRRRQEQEEQERERARQRQQEAERERERPRLLYSRNYNYDSDFDPYNDDEDDDRWSANNLKPNRPDPKLCTHRPAQSASSVFTYEKSVLGTSTASRVPTYASTNAYKPTSSSTPCFTTYITTQGSQSPHNNDGHGHYPVIDFSNDRGQRTLVGDEDAPNGYDYTPCGTDDWRTRRKSARAEEAAKSCGRRRQGRRGRGDLYEDDYHAGHSKREIQEMSREQRAKHEAQYLKACGR
ncbi:hypothetical protein B0O80DRAFT_423663 [Mortierella sp. GBAus27b]|nr:hypothetical protein BGX31_009933 [Mortierella sp. GBA43]KAI8358587.1 hypothetical protein B0O80DRAFT_423663 [Mortierella sp. GBAus27b]